MTKAQVDALWARIKAIFASKTELENKQDTLTAGTGITIDENNVISASGGGLDEISTPIYVSLGTYNASTGAYSASLPLSDNSIPYNSTWVDIIAPEIQEGLWEGTSETTVYYIKVKFDVNGTEYYTPAKFVVAGSQSIWLYVSVDGVYISILFQTGSPASASVTAYKLSHLVANEENKFYDTGLYLEELESSIGSSTYGKLSALRSSNAVDKILLIRGFYAGQDAGTYAVATVKQWGSVFEFYVDDNGTTVYVQGDTLDHWTITRTTPYVKPSGGIPSTDLSSAVQTSLGKADSALQEESVFIAEYGVTTSDEMSDAYADGKALFCKRGSIIYNCTSFGSSTITFDYTGSNSGQRAIYTFSTQTWELQNHATNEHASNKKTTLTGNESSATYYPTTKAVADYAEAKTNKVTSLSDQSTDAQYPSAKAVYDEIGPIDDLLDDILGDVDAALDDVLGGDIIPMQEKTMVEEASDTTLDAQVGKYYRFDEDVETLAVTLNHTDEAVVQTIVFSMTIGTTPAVTFTTAESGEDIYYADGFALESGKTYEVSALWNGATWMIASVTLILPTP